MNAIAQRVGGRTAAIGLVMLTVVTLLVVGNFSGILRGIVDKRGTKEVVAVFPTSQQLRSGDLVRIDGVDVGKVTGLDSIDHGNATRVTMRVDKSDGTLHRDARANLRWRTLLGSAFYVDLDRGAPDGGTLSGPIPMDHTSAQVELDDITPLIRGGARKGMQTMPRELSEALADAKTPGRLLKGVADRAPDIAEGVGAVRGQRKDADLRRLVGSTSKLVDVLGRSRGELRAVVAGAAATLQTTGGRGPALQSTLALAPGVLRNTNQTVTRLDRTLDNADPVIDQLKKPASQLDPTLRKLNPTVRDADRLLTQAVPLLKDLRPTARSLARTSKKLLPLLDHLEPSIDRVNDKILPYLAEKDPGTQQTTTNLIGGFAASWGGGFAGQRDANGGLLRFALTAGSAPLYLPCQTYVNNPDKAQVLQCESLQTTLNQAFSYSPLGPPPGTVGSSQPPGGSIAAPRKGGG